MYGIILATALTTGTTAADWGFRHGCHGCHCGCWCGCSCGCYGCYGGYCSCGCYGCYSYCGGWGCHGCWGCCGCYGCYGYCGGWGCHCGGCGCYGGCMAYGCYGCYGGCMAYGCYGCCHGGTVIYGGTYAAPPTMTPAPTDGKTIEGKDKDGKEVSIRRPATVVVKADSDVEIKVNGQATPRKTTEEAYTTPALVPGRLYSYTFVAEVTRDGKKQTETKEVTVRAGRRTVVDFTSLGTAVAKAEAEAASVTVILPEGAKLTVNDVAVNAEGKQTFQTPKLEKGKSYFYTVKAELTRDGKPVSETRRVDVAAGKEVTVDFTKGSATLTASR
jgi:uncharacterized protein (TIGR03000 family)